MFLHDHLLEAAGVGMDNFANSVTAVVWMDSEPVALAAHVGQATGEDTALTTWLCTAATSLVL